MIHVSGLSLVYEKTHLGELAHWDVDVTDSKKVTSNMGILVLDKKLLQLKNL